MNRKIFLCSALLGGLLAISSSSRGQLPEAPKVFEKIAQKKEEPKKEEPKKEEQPNTETPVKPASKSDEPKPTLKVTGKDGKDEVPEFEILFTDSSKVRLTMAIKEVAIETQFGKLNVPIKEIKRIERAVKVKDKLIDKLETTDFPIHGTIDQSTALKVMTKQFGETTLKFEQVKSIQRVFSGNVANASIDVDAEKYAKQNWQTWMNTDIDVSDEISLKITATGKIDQWAQTPNQYMSTPNGNGSIVATPFQLDSTIANPFPGVDAGPGGNGPPGFPGGAAAAQNRMLRGRVQSGNLIAKIGENGKPFIVGESISLKKPPASGRLYLIIAPSNWGNDSSGKYEVKINAGE
jgi:hypothetical protein